MSCNHPEGTKEELFAQYRQLKKDDMPYQMCPVCGAPGSKDAMEPHHPCGRDGTNILLYTWLHPTCHRWVHMNPKAARDCGMLWPGRNTKRCSDEEWTELKKLWPINTQ